MLGQFQVMTKWINYTYTYVHSMGLNYRVSSRVPMLYSEWVSEWSRSSCQTLCDPMDCSLPGSSLHGILQPRVLEWVAISFSTGSSQPRVQTRVSCIPGRRFNLWATRRSLLIIFFILLLFTQSCPTLCNPMDCSMPGFLSFTISQGLLKLLSIELLRW